jgi:ABC-type multidrug transport system fused ATPase/permease subunit
MARPLLRDDLACIATSPMVRRGAFVGLLTLAQRGLGPALVLSAFERGLASQIAAGVALGLVAAAHGVAQRVSAARAEAELFERAARSALSGDVLQRNLLVEEDAHLEIVQAIYMSAQIASHTLPNLCADAVASLLLAVLVLWVEPARLVAVGAILALAGAGLLAMSRRAVDRGAERAWALQGRVHDGLSNILEGRFEVVASGLRSTFLADFARTAADWGRAGIFTAGAGALTGRLPLWALAAGVAAALFAAFSAGGIAAPTLEQLALFVSVTPALLGLAQATHTLARQRRWVGVVARVFATAAPPASGLSPPPRLPAAIAFRGVSFRYAAGGDEVLRAIDFAATAPGALALTGPNGSGKSTCLHLLLALAAPSAGAVVVGGERLDAIDPDAWRARIAFLSQRPYLPPRADIRRAIRWLAPEASDARILGAIDRVGLGAVLRDGGRDPLAVRVDTLSVGQRQRVALARLLCRDVALYVLDEPDANLDAAGVAFVADLVHDLARDRTVVFAAHTRDLVAAATTVVHLDRGRVAMPPETALVRAAPLRPGVDSP